jgi:hypothetical protein
MARICFIIHVVDYLQNGLKLTATAEYCHRQLFFHFVRLQVNK